MDGSGGKTIGTDGESCPSCYEELSLSLSLDKDFAPAGMKCHRDVSRCIEWGGRAAHTDCYDFFFLRNVSLTNFFFFSLFCLIRSLSFFLFILSFDGFGKCVMHGQFVFLYFSFN